MRVTKSFSFALVFVVFLVFAQVRSTQAQDQTKTRDCLILIPHIALGHDDLNDPNSSEWKTILFFTHMVDGETNFRSVFMDDTGKDMMAHITFSPTNSGDAARGYGHMTGRSSGDFSLSHCEFTGCSAGLQTGSGAFLTTATWSDFENKWLPDIRIQVLFQRWEKGNVTASVGVPTFLDDELLSSGFILANIGHGMDLGLALFSPQDGTTDVTINVYDNYPSSDQWNGRKPIATKTITLSCLQHTSVFLSQIFAGMLWEDGDVYGNKLTNGSVEFVSSQAIAILPVVSNSSPGWFTVGSVPIFPLPKQAGALQPSQKK
jgi:hypothetical protein